MRRLPFFLLLLGILGSAWESPCFAADARALVVVSAVKAEQITGLVFPSLEPEVEPAWQGREFRPFAKITVEFYREGWELVWNDQPVSMSRIGGEARARAIIRLPISGESTPLRLTAVNIKGRVQKAKIDVQFKGWKEFLADFKDGRFKFFPLTVSIGPSLISYKETYAPDLSETALTAKLSYLYPLAWPPIELGLSAYLTIVPLTSNQSDATARFLGVNLRAGYRIPLVHEPWVLSLMAGVYYTTMFVTDDKFGFRNLMGPQFYPVVRRFFANGSSLGGYFKYSPVGDGAALSNLSDREIGAGISYGFGRRNGNPVSVAFDVANLGLVVDGSTISSTSYSLGVSMGL